MKIDFSAAEPGRPQRRKFENTDFFLFNTESGRFDRYGFTALMIATVAKASYGQVFFLLEGEMIRLILRGMLGAIGNV
jgi:hypothetical protein